MNWYHVDASNDLSYNGRFAYDGSPNVVLPNLTLVGKTTLGKPSLDESTFSQINYNDNI